MSHELEIINGEASMAYRYDSEIDTPWHGLGFKITEAVSPAEMMKIAKLDWNVTKIPMSYEYEGKTVTTSRQALVRSSDGKMLDAVTKDWNPCQNSTAFEFFTDWTEAGDMEMNTAGSLRGGQTVWALAKIKEGAFEACKGDTVESYLLFTNPHQYGKSIEVRQTNIRVVCNNTLTLALSRKANSMIRINHSREFNAEMVKETLNYTKAATELYHQKAQFLATKHCTPEQIHEYLNKLFPIGDDARRPDREYSKPAQKIYDVIETQPGADLAPGTFWNLWNAVTYSTNHVLGNSQDSRLNSVWFGRNQTKNIEALNLAIEMAS